MTAYFLDSELRCALIDPSASLNIMSLSMLEATGVPRDRIVEQPIEVSGLEVSASFTLCYINLNLTIGPILEVTLFHLIDA